ncbi:MAG: VCBS repeat-containing protein, partial [Deltaproteobacteria bacterium]|nr:VCBS repeat-containing protein [Deltaproteobacteria bacterium]
PNFVAAATSSIALGDVEGDGDIDIMEGNSVQPNRVWLNDGTGTFTDSGQGLGSSDTTSVALGDLDGDGDL